MNRFLDSWGGQLGGAGLFRLPVNFVTNGSFDPDLTGWTPFYADGSCTVVNEGAGHTTALKITVVVGNGFPYLHQTMTGMTVGQLYKISADHKSDLSNAAIHITSVANFSGGEVYWSGNLGANSWTALTGTFTATAATMYIRLICNNNGAQFVWFDNVVITA